MLICVFVVMESVMKMFLSLILEPLSIRFRTTDGSVEEVVVDVANVFVSKQFEYFKYDVKRSRSDWERVESVIKFTFL